MAHNKIYQAFLTLNGIEKFNTLKLNSHTSNEDIPGCSANLH